ncbi:unnamed protein product [Cunninghamella echinulata]
MDLKSFNISIKYKAENAPFGQSVDNINLDEILSTLFNYHTIKDVSHARENNKTFFDFTYCLFCACNIQDSIENRVINFSSELLEKLQFNVKKKTAHLKDKIGSEAQLVDSVLAANQ